MNFEARIPRATSLDVAALARVSQATVSRAFAGSSSITPETRARVLAAARQLNYVPNSIASSLSTSRTGIVAVILGDLTNPFYVSAFSRFSRTLQAAGRQILAFTVDPGIDADEVMLRVLRYQVDGVILTAAQLSMRMTGLSLDRGIPIVLFNRYVPGHESACVRCDNADGGRRMAELLLESGARSFGIIRGNNAATTSSDRVRGFRERLREAGIPDAACREADGFSTYEGGGRGAVSLLTTRPLPDALFCINDIMAIGAMDAIRQQLGLAVPEDLLLAGFDGIAEAARPAYAITTIEQPIEAMVEASVATLHLDEPERRINRGEDLAIPGQLVIRRTTQR
jgi:DNA-binding LacI/PurR family transcriptional regulator